MDANALTDVLRKVERSRVRLIAGSLTQSSGDDSAPWFGTLSASLVIKASAKHAHAATDGTHFFYNPRTWEKIDEREGAFVWAHEVLHCGLCHMFRKPDWVEWHEWNVCTDLAIHSILIPLAARYGWLVPKGVLYEARYDGLSAEQIAYARKKEAEQNQPPPPPDEPEDDESQEQEQEESDESTDDDSQDSGEEPDDGDAPGDEDEPQGDEEQEGDFPTQGEGDSDAEGEGDADDLEEPGTEASDADDADGGADEAGQGEGEPQEGDGTLTPEDDLRPPPPAQDGDDAGDDSGAQPGDGDEPCDDESHAGEHENRAQPRTEDDWQQMVEQAMAVSKKAGAMPGNVERAIDQGRPTGVAWRDIMRQFIEAVAPSRETWARPNKRYLASGLYLPSDERENVPPLLIGIDTSASITDAMLADFSEQVQVIWSECKPRALYVVYCDTDVAHVEVFDRQAGDDEIELHNYGGGGTEFQPVFDYCAEQIEAGEWEKPAACVYLTDLECWSTPVEPDYPVLWACVPGTYATAPFGETVRLD